MLFRFNDLKSNPISMVKANKKKQKKTELGEGQIFHITIGAGDITSQTNVTDLVDKTLVFNCCVFSTYLVPIQIPTTPREAYTDVMNIITGLAKSQRKKQHELSKEDKKEDPLTQELAVVLREQNAQMMEILREAVQLRSQQVEEWRATGMRHTKRKLEQ